MPVLGDSVNRVPVTQKVSFKTLHALLSSVPQQDAVRKGGGFVAHESSHIAKVSNHSDLPAVLKRVEDHPAWHRLNDQLDGTTRRVGTTSFGTSL